MAKKFTHLFLSLLIVLTLGFNAALLAAAQTTCPIMGGEKIDKKIFLDYKGKRVYFCCKNCIKTFKADPEKYIKQMEKEKIELEKAPAGKK